MKRPESSGTDTGFLLLQAFCFGRSCEVCCDCVCVTPCLNLIDPELQACRIWSTVEISDIERDEEISVFSTDCHGLFSYTHFIKQETAQHAPPCRHAAHAFKPPHCEHWGRKGRMRA
ncbi:hypothetical protein TM1040_3841 (plasmid) [Ruegeria sp. TM1040]|nr:hypothetical protein TM1040_3841 [Ruegeria sp. TM1040]